MCNRFCSRSTSSAASRSSRFLATISPEREQRIGKIDSASQLIRSIESPAAPNFAKRFIFASLRDSIRGVSCARTGSRRSRARRLRPSGVSVNASSARTMNATWFFPAPPRPTALFDSCGRIFETGNHFQRRPRMRPRAAPSRIASCNSDVNNGFERHNPDRAPINSSTGLESRQTRTTSGASAFVNRAEVKSARFPLFAQQTATPVLRKEASMARTRMSVNRNQAREKRNRQCRRGD